MPFNDGIGSGAVLEDSLLAELARFIGTTVTIFMTSGGQSGFGVTGVLTSVNPSIIKLITCIGPAPCCPLGSACSGMIGRPGFRDGFGFRDRDRFGFRDRDRFGSDCINNVGSETIIPVNRIAAFVHNAV